MESQPKWEDFIDAEDYLNGKHKFNINHRLVLLFHRIDVDPSDGFVTEHELTEWNLEQSKREVFHRSQREMKLHDKTTEMKMKRQVVTRAHGVKQVKTVGGHGWRRTNEYCIDNKKEISELKEGVIGDGGELHLPPPTATTTCLRCLCAAKALVAMECLILQPEDQERKTSVAKLYMAEEFQAEVCGGNWWSSPRTTTFTGSSYIGNYGGCYQNYDFMNTKTWSTEDSSSNTHTSIISQKSGGCATAISPDSAFQMMGSPPSTTTNWNQALLINGRNEDGSIFNETLPEILNNLNSGGQDSGGFDMDQQQTSNFMTNSGDSTGNLVSSTSSYGYPSSLLQTLFDSTSPAPRPLYDFEANLSEFNPVSSMPRFTSLVKPKQQDSGGLGLGLVKTPFWNNASVLDSNDNRAGFFGSTQSRYLSSTYEEKPNCPNLIKSQNEEIRDMGSSMKKNSGESTFKRPRLETPSPLPTFKVRKEKLGDRVTALQQLVSPFGKTDTASVLHEAIEYIKLLHDQVNVLSAPYMKNGATMQRQQIHDRKVKDSIEGAKQHDLRSRGLCLVPVSSTFPVTTETVPDYWSSSFGNTFR
ncbi:hypothetical protein L6452_35376 [Arctium lappa]|uniref:Uncharacterized protein n=1 Tax=Arctium lappa TaxID=4217 RepID=A0ACB8YAG7_ARCLA|nr:hypothetical protein L6452_35376 [Arctium lappa]